MTSITGFIAKHPVWTYVALTFAISWGGVLLVIGGPAGITGTAEETDPLFPLAVLAMIAGPSVAGILLTGLVHGRAGLRDFRSRLLERHVDARWYAVALLAAPLTAITVLLVLSAFSREFVPSVVVTEDKVALVLYSVAVALGAGVFEELGWTGFAVPELRRRYGLLTTGIIVGALWGAWHFLVVMWGVGDRAGSLPLALFVVLDSLSFLPAFRVLMVWVYDRTGSLLVGMLMHVSLTATTLILWPVATGGHLLTYNFAFAAAVWVVVAAITVTNGRQLSRQTLRRRVA